ncbi:hypothetical protein BDV93DRAFT_547344 [Ceratobasidium sp. AG-I]|nr:hypothetical protein BDV93DRAFT_547344 [Ceratobasidium sp. AG-I]
MAESLDGHSIDGLSCRSSTLVAESDVLTITAMDEKNEDLDFVFSWYHTLAVTEFSELQLRRLDGKDSKVFLVAVLCDQSICCIGLGITENLNLLPILGAKGTSDVSFYQPSYMPELAKSSSMLVNLRFSHRRRDLIDLLQILHCVQSSLTAIPSPAGLNDIYVWTSLIIFERTFWDWDKWAAQLQRDAIVGASVTAAKAEYDSLAARRSSIVHIPTGRFSAPPVNSQPESRSKSMDMLCSILTAEWDSAMRAVNDTLVHDSLRDNIYLSLVEAVTRSARAAAIQSATTAAHAAAKSATQTSAKECAYNAAWESLWDAGGTEDDIIGRGGLAYIAECVAEGIPRLEHDSDMQLLRTSPCASRPGWLIGCNAGWVEGWRAGRRAAMRFTWDALGGDLPLGEWSGDLDAGWDAAWEKVSPADRLVTRPHVGREAGRSEYNVSWDDGWELGCQAGYDVGWESGRDGAKLSARRSWRRLGDLCDPEEETGG